MNEAKSEKVSVNINVGTLSAIDLLVDHGYYSNRSDFINQAVRGALLQQQSTIDRIVERKQSGQNSMGWFIGISGYNAAEIEEAYAAGEQFSVSGYGLLVIDPKCDEEKLFSVITEIRVKGRVSCTAAVRAHYGL